MVKRRKTAKAKPSGLASLPQGRQDERRFDDDFDPDLGHRRTGPGGATLRVPRMYRVGGAPLQDPKDKRLARFAMRMHPDLIDSVAQLARSKGWKVSQLVEKTLIDLVNGESKRPIVDQIGRYIANR